MLYRDALGLVPHYDEVVPISGNGLPTGVFETQARLVFLRSGEEEAPLIGALGLLQYLDDEAQPGDSAGKEVLRRGDTVLVFNADRVEERMAMIEKIENVRIVSRGTVDVYPAPGGRRFRVVGNSFFDMDGHFVELNEVVSVEAAPPVDT